MILITLMLDFDPDQARSAKRTAFHSNSTFLILHENIKINTHIHTHTHTHTHIIVLILLGDKPEESGFFRLKALLL